MKLAIRIFALSIVFAGWLPLPLRLTPTSSPTICREPPGQPRQAPDSALRPWTAHLPVSNSSSNR